MRLGEIKLRYQLHEYKKDHFVAYSATEKGKRYPDKFLCEIISVKKGFYSVGDFPPTENIQELVSNIEKHVDSLPYDSEYYHPQLLVGHFENYIIRDYMTETLGFKLNFNSDYPTFQFHPKNVYNFASQKVDISFRRLDPWDCDLKPNTSSWNNREALPKDIEIILWTGGESGWFTITVEREVEKIKKAIDSLLKPLMVGDSLKAFQEAEKMEHLDFKQLDVILTRFSGLDMQTSSYKQTLKTKLEGILATL